jgi:hypothetical protein
VSNKRIRAWQRSFAPGSRTSRIRPLERLADRPTVAEHEGAVGNRRDRRAARTLAKKEAPNGVSSETALVRRAASRRELASARQRSGE